MSTPEPRKAPEPLASFISERAYFTKKDTPTATDLKERLQKTSLPRLEVTLEYLNNKNPFGDGSGWYDNGFDGGALRAKWHESRVKQLHFSRIAALEAVIDTKLREKEKLVAYKQKLKEHKREKAQKAREKAREKAKNARDKEKLIAKKQKLKERNQEKAKKARAKAQQAAKKGKKGKKDNKSKKGKK
tara:strand:- start:670 stop:1233 length:564 start_codon:yes stop_codon:yes gene_type:complete